MNQKKKDSRFDNSRREFIQGSALSALGLTNMGLLAEAVFQGIFHKAYAQENGIINKNYIFIGQAGAPPRWAFDLPLTPDGQKGKFIACPQVGTRYEGGTRYTEVVHDTYQVNGLHMPWMWRFDIPTAGGGMVPLSRLMEGMLIMRGIDTNNPAHVAAQGLHYRPQGIPISLTALTADRSDAPIAGVSMSSSRYVFKSNKGLSPTQLANTNNMIQTLMQPFIESNPTGYKNDQAKVEAALASSLDSLNKIAEDSSPQNVMIKKNMENALDLFSKNYGSLDTVYNNLYNKYRSLARRAMDPNRTLVGINDKPIGTTGARDRRYRYGDDDGTVTNADLRTMITTNTNLDRTAQRFAVTEFILLNGLSSSIAFNHDGLRGLGTQGQRNSQFYDEHRAGCMPSLLVNVYNSLGFYACLYELISQLKANRLFEDTLIDFCGEFGRNPQNQGSGADHSAEANSNMIISGAIGGNGHVIGNIRANAGGRNGTWGYGANNPGFGLLNLGHFTSTVANVFGIPSPVTAVPSLLKLEGGKLVPKLPTGTIID